MPCRTCAAMLGVLRTDDQGMDLAPQPKLSELADLLERVRATGLAVSLCQEGIPFSLGDALELTLYRIVQESLTNTIRHATARKACVSISYTFPCVNLVISDDGTTNSDAQPHRARDSGHERKGRSARRQPHVRSARDRRLGRRHNPTSHAQDMSTSILLVDDQALIRQGFRMILEAEDDLTVVGEAADGAEAVRLATNEALMWSSWTSACPVSTVSRRPS